MELSYMNEQERDNEEGLKRKSKLNQKRETWGKKIDFVFSCVGFAVGLGNIWRFPYLCYKNGGGAFLVTYLLCLVCGGVPMFILEIALGQYMSKGGLSAWDICPLFKGIGFATMVILFLMNIYYIMALCWSVFYFVMSLTATLPWSHCNNYWNTERCAIGIPRSSGINTTTIPLIMSQNFTLVNAYKLSNLNGTIYKDNAAANRTIDPVLEFWERRVIQISDGIDQPRGIIWEQALCLLFAWLVVYFCIWKGVKWTGKIVYFTATFPYVILTILLIRGLTLEGASYGIEYYLKPDFSRLTDPQVWVDGGTQIFFSYAIAIGAMITLGSYNKFNNNFYKDCFVIMAVNTGTSLYGGLAVFSVLGFMATRQGVDISEVAESGPSLAFLTYPKAVTEMPLSPLWSILFFFMIFLVGLDSQFVGVEAFITPVVDAFPQIFYNKKKRLILVAVYCFVSYLCGLSMVTQGGIYVFQLFDYYSASGMVLLWLLFLEAVTIGWVFGAERFHDAIELMIGYRISRWWSICWKYLSPLITMGILIFQIVKFVPLKYNNIYVYPTWAQVFGICLAGASMICVPIVIIVKLSMVKGSIRQRLKVQTTPVLEKHQIPEKWRQSKSFQWIHQSDYNSGSSVTEKFAYNTNDAEKAGFI